MLLKNVLTIDPGLTTAWAYWNGTAFPAVGEFHCPRSLSTVVQRIPFMLDKFESVLQATGADRVIMEMVELWEGSDKSRMSAVRGDTFNLALLIGAYFGMACYTYDMSVELPSARAWKGQLTKEATAYRVNCINGEFYTSEHITDAVALGFSRDYDIWHLKKEKFTKEER